MQIDELVREGRRSVSGMTGCAPHILNHQWVSVGGALCVRGGGGGGGGGGS